MASPEHCAKHKKRNYASKADAVEAMSKTPDRRWLNVFPCSDNKKVFHVGHRARRLSPLLRLERATKRGAL